MTKIYNIKWRILFLILIICLPEIIAIKKLHAQKKIRVGLVYNASHSGYRYRDGVMNVIGTDDRFEIIEKAYIKAPHGEDTIKKMIRNDEVDVILGPTDSEVFTKVYNTDGISDNKISVISGMATTNVGNTTQDYFFRLNLEATSRIFEIWSFMNKFWISKIAIMYEDSEYGRHAEIAFKNLLTESTIGDKYTSIAFESPDTPIHQINKLIKDRPEVIGLFCGREDVQRIYREIQMLNNSGVPYNPYFFSLIDLTTVGEGLENFYFPSLKEYADNTEIKTELEDKKRLHDEVYILGVETGNLLIEALKKSGTDNNLTEPKDRVLFRNQVVSILKGESKSGVTMNFLRMKNLGPPYLYKIKNNRIYTVEHDLNMNWISMVKAKLNLVYAIHNYKLIINLLLMIILTISLSTIEIRRSFPKKHVKIYYTPVFYYYLFFHLLVVFFLYIFLAHTGRINYSDTLMVIIITITPSAFFKTTLFETKSGQSFGLEGLYKRVMASIDGEIMKSRYKKLVGLENVIAYSNSQDSMQSALLRIYRNNPSPIQSAKLIQKMEEDITNEKDYMNRRRAAAKLIMRQFDKEQLKAEGFVPNDWDFEDNIDPMILLRHAAKYCVEDNQRRKNVYAILKTELEDLKERSPLQHKEIEEVHNKELSITMSAEGELLVKLRLLFVLVGFKIGWILEKDFLSDDLLEDIRKSGKAANK